MTRDEALKKLPKLLQLSASSNPHEAAAALRQAQALMQEHAIDGADLEGLEPIAEVKIANRGARPSVYAVGLADTVCAAFAVQWILATTTSRRQRSHCRFVGPRSRAEIAGYAYQVLLRQCERDRRKHLVRVRLPKNRAARGDLFGLGWVKAVRDLVGAFAGADADQVRIAAYLTRQHGPCQSRQVAARTSKAVVIADAAAGIRAGRRARLHRGMPTETQTPMALERMA